MSAPFDTMLRRALRKHARAGGYEGAEGSHAPTLLDIKTARAVMASQKGRHTLFKGAWRPGIGELIDEFDGWAWPKCKMMDLSKLILGAKDQEMVARALSGAAGLKDSHACWEPIGALPYASFHDSHIASWTATPGHLEVVFDGYFSNGASDDLNKLALVFTDPKVEMLCSARAAWTRGEGAWKRKAEGQPPFAWRFGQDGSKERVDFSQVCYIMMEEFADKEEAHPAIRLSLGGSRQMEISIEAREVEIAWGMGAIQARRDRDALGSCVPRAAKSRGPGRM